MRFGLIVLALVVVIGLLAVAYRRGRLAGVSGVVLALAVVAFAIAFLAIAADYRDADGFVDCWPNCSPFQDTVGVTFFAAPLAAFTALIGLVVAATFSRRRGRR